MTTRRQRSHIQRTREKIRAAKLLDRVISFIKGDLKMTNKQVDAALRLINKISPDLKAVEVELKDDKSAQEMTIADLARRIEEAEAGISEAEGSPRELH